MTGITFKEAAAAFQQLAAACQNHRGLVESEIAEAERTLASRKRGWLARLWAQLTRSAQV